MLGTDSLFTGPIFNGQVQKEHSIHQAQVQEEHLDKAQVQEEHIDKAQVQEEHIDESTGSGGTH